MNDIAALLRSKKAEDRIRAVQRLARSEALGRQTLLLEALQDKTNYVAAMAAEALGHCADWSAAAAMVTRFLYLSEDGLKRDPGCHIRAHLAFAFGRLEYLPSTEALRIGIRTVQIEPVGGVPYNTALHLRANCALALAQMRAPDALRDITLLLFDHGTDRIGVGDEKRIMIEPRKAAAQALARLGSVEAIVPLTLRLRFSAGESPEVLQECMQALVALEDPRAVELLTPYLRHPDPHLSAYAGLMIAQTRAPEAPVLLRELILRLSGDPLQAAVLALTTVRTEAAVAVLLELTESERESVRLAVVEALADTQEEKMQQRLMKVAKEDKSARVRAAAKRALES